MKRFLVFGLFALFLITMVNAATQEVNYTISSGGLDQNDLLVTQLRYEPFPVNPGEYFDLYIKAQQGSGSAPNAVFELVPEFPFSIDSNEDVSREYGKLYSEPVVLHYKVRVSPDAVEGTNEIKLKYNSGSSGSAWVLKTFDIEVADAQTDFDLVVQDSTGSEVSLAIANTGKNPANSLIVRIPNQDGFKISGATGQMVGNLDSGDYSIVSFNLAQVGRSNNVLKVQMDYTDTIGVRRSVEKQVEFNFGSSVGNLTNFSRSSGYNRNATTTSSTSLFANAWFWVVVVVVAGAVVYVVYRKKHMKSQDRSTQKEGKETPEWVAANRKKEKLK